MGLPPDPVDSRQEFDDGQTLQDFRGGIGTFIVDNDVEIILVGLPPDPVDSLQQEWQSFSSVQYVGVTTRTLAMSQVWIDQTA